MEKEEKLLELDVVTPERVMVTEHVEQVNVPGIEGDLGILLGHTALLTTLRPGSLSYKKGEDIISMVVTGGYLEVSDNRVIVLADDADFLDEIDREYAEKEKSEAENLLEKTDLTNSDFQEAQLKLFRAVARLEHSPKE